MREIKIRGKIIGQKQPPFIIAEMSGNHNQSLDKALAIVEAAAKCGVQALKIQTYTADTMTLDIDKGEFLINDQKSPWKGASLYKLYEKAYTPWEWHKPIFDYCRKLGIIGFSTPFDGTAVDFLESLEVPCYKVASFENTDIPFIRKIAATGKPLLISTGMASREELVETINTSRQAGCKDLILLKCTSVYPADPKDLNIRTILDMRDSFGCQVGISDHSLGIGAAVASIAFGSCVIEKHFTLSRSEGGVDCAFSLEPAELSSLARESRNAWLALGKISYNLANPEKKSLMFRRSLYIVQDIAKGDPLTNKNLRAIRPGLGLAPKHYDVLLGKKAGKNLKKGTPVSWDMLE